MKFPADVRLRLHLCFIQGQFRAFLAGLFLILLCGASQFSLGQFKGPFSESRSVYAYPDGFIPEGLSARGIQELDKRAESLNFPFYIVILRDLPTTTGSSTDEDAERAIVGIAEQWAKDPRFDRNQSSIFLISYGPGDRKFRLLPAPRWRSELGLEYDALEQFTTIFRQGARRDVQGAIARMMTEYDTHIFDRVDPKRVAEREAQRNRAEADARLQTARYQLDSQISALQAALLLPTRFLPPNTGAASELLDRARNLRGNGSVDELTAAAEDLRRVETEIRTTVQRRISEESATKQRQGLQLAGGTVTFGLIAFGTVRRRRRYVQDRESLDSKLDEWRSRISNARQRYFQFDDNRDRAPHLRGFGGRTRELYELASTEIDSIIIGVEAISVRVDEIAGMAARASFVDRRPLDKAIEFLDQPFKFDTGSISEKLFEPQTTVIEVTPERFFADLSERYDAAVRDWKRLNDSVTLSLHIADELFPHDRLDRLFERVNSQNIPVRWLKGHPLIGTDSDDQDLYNRIDASRKNDPVRFAEEVDALIESERRIEEEIERLIQAVNRTRTDSNLRIDGLEGSRLAPDDDPSISLEEATYLYGQLGFVLESSDTVEEVESHCEAISRLFAKCRDQIGTALHAIQCGAAEADTLHRRLQDSSILDQQVEARLREISQDHRNVGDVKKAQSAGRQFLSVGKSDHAKATAKLADQRHLDGFRDARHGIEQVEKADARFRLALEICARLEAQKAEYLRTLAQMEGYRAQTLERIRRYRGSPGRIGSWSPPRLSGPSDFGVMLGVLVEQQRAWDETARQAQRAYEELERQRREAEEAERRRREANLYRSSSYSSGSSWSGSSSSSGSGSSGGSFRSGGSGSSGGSW